MRYSVILGLFSTLIGQMVFANEVSRPTRNTFLAADYGASTHFDPAQTDSMPFPIARGTFKVDLRKTPHVIGGPVTGAVLASPSADYMWTSGPAGVVYIDSRNGAWKELARLPVQKAHVIPLEVHEKALDQQFTSIDAVENVVHKIYGIDHGRDWIEGGIYGLVDNDNTLFSTYGGTDIYAFSLINPAKPEQGIKIRNSIKVTDVLGEGERLFALQLTYDGWLVAIGRNAVAVIDRELKSKPIRVKLGKGEEVRNGGAVDEKGGIYVATNKNMHKLVWNGAQLATDKNGAWISPYDTDSHNGASGLQQGTGSTPTLVGFGNDADKLVVITDGSDRMKLVAFWRDEIPKKFKQKKGTKSRRIADQIEVKAGFAQPPRFIQSEQSVVSKGYGAFVVNNIGDEKMPEDALVNAIALGPVVRSAHGVERFEWDPKEHKWRSVWARNDVSSLTTVPSVSIPSNIVLVNGYSKKDGWEVTGMDWMTGETVHRTIFGQDNFGNGAYMINQLSPSGDLIFPSITGPFRINWK